MSSFYVLGTMLNTLAVLFYLILTVIQQGRYFFNPHFMDGEIEGQRG